MKKIIAGMLAALMLFTVVGCTAGPVVSSDPATAARTWIEKQIKNNTLFSFDYDGVAYAEHITGWEKTIEEGNNTWTVTYKKDNMVVWSEITMDEALASLEWTNYFKNEGADKSPVISNIQAINSTVTVENPILTTAEGSAPSNTDFQPVVCDLAKESKFNMYTYGGRSSQGAWPYWDLSNGKYGVMGGIGWTGDWIAKFVHDNGTVSITAGMKETNIALYAGEDMRTPLYMLLFYNGNEDDGHNAFRRVILKNYTPTDKAGDPITYAPMFTSVNAAMGEDEMLEVFQYAEESGRRHEGLWIDATWYGNLSADSEISDNAWSGQVGNWFFIRDAYPNGNMLKVSNWLEENNLELLVWFEPERAIKGTELTVEHPDWFLNLDNQPDSEFWLFDFTNNEARDYMIDKIGGIIAENKITWYRQDFNCDPAPRWKARDARMGKDRVGMTEIQYITNLYYYLDALVENNPGLMIDNCASGGKRLDLEMMKRSVPLWRSDLTCSEDFHSTPDTVRNLNYNLSWWLPIHACGYPYYESEGELYNMRSYLSSSAQLGWDHRTNQAVKKAIDEYYINREMMAGDYYILSRGFDDEIKTKIAAYEYYLPEEGRGFLITFRPSLCTGTDQAVHKLKGLESDATYEITISDTGATMSMTGEQLMSEGLGCIYPEPAFSLVIYFNKK